LLFLRAATGIYLPNFRVFPLSIHGLGTDKIDVMFSWAFAGCFLYGAMIAFRSIRPNLQWAVSAISLPVGASVEMSLDAARKVRAPQSGKGGSVTK